MEVSERSNDPKLAVGFVNNYLSISEPAIKTISNNNYTTPLLITSEARHYIKKYPICGKTTSDMTSIQVLLNVNTLSTNSSASVKIRLGFRGAKL